MNAKEIASKAGRASALARQSPQLIAHKAQAIVLHKAGKDTGEIGRALSRERTEIRRWLIASGIYHTLGRGKSVAGRRRYDATRLVLAQYESEFRQIAKTDEVNHWLNHPAIAARAALIRYRRDKEMILSNLRERYKTEPLNKRLRRLLATRITHAIKRHNRPTRKHGKTMELIGCTLAELRAHIERQLTSGMSWDNYGRNGWHIDHKRPCNSFDLTDTEQQRICFHFSNLQPLWEAENISKSDKWKDNAA